MSTAIVIILVVVVVLAALAVAGRMRMRRRHLQRQFGPEYERAVRSTGSRREAEQDLAERERRHNEMPLRALPADARDRYAGQWLDVQELFVDDPVRAVGAADRLIVDVMTARGYETDAYQPTDAAPPDGSAPTADRATTDPDTTDRATTDRAVPDPDTADGYQRQLADLSVQHAQRLPDYRAAHEISGRAAAGTASTEDLRQAMVHYRSLFEELLGDRVRTGRGDTA